MKRGGPLRRSDRRMAPGGLPAPTKAQEKLWSRLVDEVGCAVCRFHMGIEDSPAEIHHLLEGQRRISHTLVISLCSVHHRQGVAGHPSRHSVNGSHGGLDAFERAYGSERTLLEACERWIDLEYSRQYQPETPTDDEAQDTDDRDTDTDANLESVPGHESDAAHEATTFTAPVRLDFVHYRYKLADPDGLCIKALLDGFVKAGLFRDDSAEEIQSITHRQVKVPRSEEERTILTIEEIEHG